MRLRNKIPPPVVAAVFLALIFLSRNIASLQFPFQNYLAVVFLVAGIAVMILGVLEFRKRQTTVNPLKPETATALVTGGIFRLTRNPMYLGLLGLLVAWSIYLGALASIVLLPAFTFYMNVLQISAEEQAMEKLFGDSYTQYRARVRRWL